MRKPWTTKAREIVTAAQQAAKAVTPTKKKAPPRERTGGYWPDDDLAELEHPRKATPWIPDRKDWLT